MDRHLLEDEIEAFAHGRDELVGHEAHAHLSRCPSCAETVSLTQALSQRLGAQLREQASEPTFEIDDLISAILRDAERPLPQVALRTPLPPRRTLVAGGMFGLLVAATTGVLSRPDLPSLTTVYEGLRISRAVFGAIDRHVVAQLPGGWGLVMVSAWLLLAMLLLPTRFLLTRGALRLPRLTATGLLGLMLLLGSVPARAFNLEGELPEQKRVSLNVMREPTSKVLGRVADAAGLGLVVTLPDDPLVTVRVKQASLREVLTAVLGEQPVDVRVDGKLLIVRASQTPVAPAPTPEQNSPPQVSPPSDPAPSKAPLVTTLPSVPVPPPPPPSPPLPRKRSTDKVVMGGSATIGPGERVRDAVVIGGSLTVYGTVEGDAVAIGGHIRLMPGSVVQGELVAMGGSVEQTKGATVMNEEQPEDEDDDDDADQQATDDSDGNADEDDDAVEPAFTIRTGRDEDRDRGDEDDEDEDEDEDESWLALTLSSLSQHALLFVLGLVLLSVWPRRLDALGRTIRRAPVRTFGVGVLAALATSVLSLLLLITILGIPAGIVLALGAALAMYAGLAAASLALGKLLPIPRLMGNPVLQLAAGVFILFLLARIPVVGAVAAVIAAAVGLGAIVRTRLSETAPGDETPSAPPPVETIVADEPVL